MTRRYVVLMHGLLDLTDNLVGGQVVHPDDVRVLDDDDPYLVVAADKGTATFSDTANAVSEEVGFWLGDAFASAARPATTRRRSARPRGLSKRFRLAKTTKNATADAMMPLSAGSTHGEAPATPERTTMSVPTPAATAAMASRL